MLVCPQSVMKGIAHFFFKSVVIIIIYVFFYVNDGSFFKDLFICFSLLEN